MSHFNEWPQEVVYFFFPRSLAEERVSFAWLAHHEFGGEAGEATSRLSPRDLFQFYVHKIMYFFTVGLLE